MQIHIVRRRHCRKVLLAVHDSFNTYDAPDYTEAGCRSFMGYASLQNFAYRQRRNHISFFIKERREIAGMVELRGFRHISMLFVAPKFIGQGYGGALIRHAIAHAKAKNPSLAAVTVNASPCAHAFYLHIGFLDAEPTTDAGGMIYTPMRLSL